MCKKIYEKQKMTRHIYYNCHKLHKNCKTFLTKTTIFSLICMCSLERNTVWHANWPLCLLAAWLGQEVVARKRRSEMRFLACLSCEFYVFVFFLHLHVIVRQLYFFFKIVNSGFSLLDLAIRYLLDFFLTFNCLCTCLFAEECQVFW